MKLNRNTLAFAAAFLTLPLFAVAQTQSSQSAPPDPATRAQASQMVSANAMLLHDLDAKKDHAGSIVRAKLNTTIHLTDGTKLASGTILVGHIVQDQMEPQGQTSRLAFDFNQAQLKDGKTLPIMATIVGVTSGTSGNVGYLVEPGDKWTNGPLQIDQVGVMPGIDLHSQISGNNSGVLVSSKKSDVKLRQGSNFQLAIGAGNTQAAATS